MKDAFAEVKLFQVKPEKLEAFESLIPAMAHAQQAQPGCLSIKYMKRFYVFDEIGQLPRELTKIVKCVKYYAYWEFDSRERYGQATAWFFAAYGKEVQKLLIMPFDIHCGNALY